MPEGAHRDTRSHSEPGKGRKANTMRRPMADAFPAKLLQDAAPTRLVLPKPARAIRARLLAAVEVPSWAVYLPKELLQRPPKGLLGAGLPCGMATPPAAWPEEAAAEAFEDSGGAAVMAVRGRVWLLSRDRNGCREVQRAFDEAGNDDARALLAAELKGHVWEALRCPHANFVLQKCIVATRPQHLNFLIEELMQKGVAAAARHKYGCRIIQRLLEHCEPEQLADLADTLIADSIALSRHVYANFVMQHLLEHGAAPLRCRLTRLLEQHAYTTGSDMYASAVVAKALTHAAPDDQVALARALVREAGLLPGMARNRYGHTAVRLILQILEGSDCEAARRQLSAHAASLRTSRYGRLVVASLDSTTGKRSHAMGGA